MKRYFGLLVIFFLLLPVSSGPSAAATLTVSPVLIDVPYPGAATTLTLRNEGTAPINVQIRVFRWAQGASGEILEPTRMVVASPPAAALAPKSDYTVRVVRVSKEPVVGEESYRIFVDQLPDRSQKKTSAVRFVIRYSIPVFFSASNTLPPSIAWSVQRDRNSLVLAAENRGDRRERLSMVELVDQRGRRIALNKGLFGYVLGKSTARWKLAVGRADLSAIKSIRLTGNASSGGIDVLAPVTRNR